MIRNIKILKQQEKVFLLNNPSVYTDFKIQINTVNREYWDGSKSVDPYGNSIPAENSKDML